MARSAPSSFSVYRVLDTLADLSTISARLSLSHDGRRKLIRRVFYEIAFPPLPSTTFRPLSLSFTAGNSAHHDCISHTDAHPSTASQDSCITSPSAPHPSSPFLLYSPSSISPDAL
jgi:hypothetical protein